ncbi:MAG: glycosyltransferase family 4 protein, partial [Bacteroidales bacterium]|nr:glycosyltransferase family 4 protein [Bacteroidales bacterium]
PHISCKGGITSVFKNYLTYKNNSFCSFLLHPVRKDGKKINKIFYIFPSLISFIYKLVSKKIDIIHIHPSENFGFYRYIPFVYIARLMKRYVILHMHGCKFDVFYNNSNKIAQRIVRNTLNNSDAIIVLSKSWAGVYSKISSTKIYIVNNSVPQPNNNPYSINSNSITFMGFIGHRKGVFDLLESVKDLSGKYDYHLEICGSGEENKLENKIKEYDIQSKITFHGWIGLYEKDIILRKTKIFILPSYNEGLPMVLLEAMSYGIPIISTPVGGIPELVEKENGFLVKPGDISSLKEKIQCLLGDSALRKQISINNYNKIKEKFSMDYTFNRLGRIYSEILN